MEDRVQDKELGMGSLSLEKGKFKGGHRSSSLVPAGFPRRWSHLLMDGLCGTRDCAQEPKQEEFSPD